MNWSFYMEKWERSQDNLFNKPNLADKRIVFYDLATIAYGFLTSVRNYPQLTTNLTRKLALAHKFKISC